jgi:hypothetical protein
VFRGSDIEVTLLSLWPFRHTAARLLHRNSLHLTVDPVGTWNRTNGLAVSAQISSGFEFRPCLTGVSARALDKTLHLKLHVRAVVISGCWRLLAGLCGRGKENAGTASTSHTMEPGGQITKLLL